MIEVGWSRARGDGEDAGVVVERGTTPRHVPAFGSCPLLASFSHTGGAVWEAHSCSSVATIILFVFPDAPVCLKRGAARPSTSATLQKTDNTPEREDIRSSFAPAQHASALDSSLNHHDATPAHIESDYKTSEYTIDSTLQVAYARTVEINRIIGTHPPAAPVPGCLQRAVLVLPPRHQATVVCEWPLMDLYDDSLSLSARLDK